MQNGDKQAQIQNFNSTLLKHGAKERDISYDNWLEMFQHLVLFLDKKPKTIKQIIFLDELPWLANYQEDILTGLSFFWNSWAVNNNVILIVSGSSASWMRQKVINNTGGLYGRTTKRIFLKPFNLRETEKYFIHRGMNFSRLQIAELYMIFGGIPYYLQEIKGDKNIAQNIDDICFFQSRLIV